MVAVVAAQRHLSWALTPAAAGPTQTAKACNLRALRPQAREAPGLKVDAYLPGRRTARGGLGVKRQR
jgi:hypothetical protein